MAIERVQSHQLPCGRLVEDVFDTLAVVPIDSHEQTCQHCQTARRSLESLMEATRALVDDTESPTPGLVDRIMQAVRTELRSGERLDLPSDFGPAQVSEGAVAAVLRFIADGVDGVRAQSCQVKPLPNGKFTVSMSVSLHLDANSGPQRLDAVRTRVANALAGQIGIVAESVDLTVADIWTEDSK